MDRTASEWRAALARWMRQSVQETSDMQLRVRMGSVDDWGEMRIYSDGVNVRSACVAADGTEYLVCEGKARQDHGFKFGFRCGAIWFRILDGFSEARRKSINRVRA